MPFLFNPVTFVAVPTSWYGLEVLKVRFVTEKGLRRKESVSYFPYHEGVDNIGQRMRWVVNVEHKFVLHHRFFYVAHEMKDLKTGEKIWVETTPLANSGALYNGLLVN